MTWNRVGMWTVLLLVAVVAIGGAVVGGVAIGRESGGVPERHGKFGTSTVTLDVGELPNSDCWYEVDQRDDDGKPGGTKTVNVEPLCP